jgi:DNA-binding protein HU-beta
MSLAPPAGDLVPDRSMPLGRGGVAGDTARMDLYPRANYDCFRPSYQPTQRSGGVRGMAASIGSKTQTTVTLKHIAASIAESHKMPKKHAEELLGDTIGLLVKHLKKGDRIRIAGFGVLQVRKRAARMGRNPATGQPIQIKASKKVAFRASKDLKEAV